ncbi:hypothetical protein [Glutamicibacter sp. BW77]|uniref:hypothetical protein n=1 Tax=Glutamicibacter TaxID=1742989 RepID=UPI000BB87963|nr:hypothetical protein [Glutamicibacter sp. BW77]PCC36763.1 hypothetical protein CIK74_03925 [Glutamicibacter sp. BW77]
MGSRIAARLGAVLLIVVLGALAVAVAVFLAMGAVNLIQRGAGTHLEEPPTPSMEFSEPPADPLPGRPSGP